MPGNRPGRRRLLRRSSATRSRGRSRPRAATPRTFTFAAQLSCGATRGLAARGARDRAGVPRRRRQPRDPGRPRGDGARRPRGRRRRGRGAARRAGGAASSIGRDWRRRVGGPRGSSAGDDAGLRDVRRRSSTPSRPSRRPRSTEIRWSDDALPGRRPVPRRPRRPDRGRRVGRADLHVRGDVRRHWFGLHVLPGRQAPGPRDRALGGLLGGRPRAGQDRPPDGRLGAPRGRRRVPRAPRVRGHRAREDGPARPARA